MPLLEFVYVKYTTEKSKKQPEYNSQFTHNIDKEQILSERKAIDYEKYETLYI